MLVLQLILSMLVPFGNPGGPSGYNTLEITIEGLPTNTGDVYIGVYEGPDKWLNEPALLGGKAVVNEDGTATLKLWHMIPGEYAISFFHDANGNGALDRNFIGYPSEAFGFSAGAKAIISKPAFGDATFEYIPDMELRLEPQ